MKRFFIIVAATMLATTTFAQGYSEQQLASVMDSVSSFVNQSKY